MDNRIYYPQRPILPADKPAAIPTKGQHSQQRGSSSTFNQIFEKELSSVKFSQHAIQRLESRNIKLSRTDLEKLQGAIYKAAQKGARESLVLMNNDLALIVSVKNNTVVTAMDGASIKENVFTNIDSAVIV